MEQTKIELLRFKLPCERNETKKQLEGKVAAAQQKVQDLQLHIDITKVQIQKTL